MQTSALNPTMSLNELRQLDVAISHQLDERSPAADPEGCRLLLRQRAWVRSQVNARLAAETN